MFRNIKFVPGIELLAFNKDFSKDFASGAIHSKKYQKTSLTKNRNCIKLMT